ncbi:MAG: 4-hydroxy-tetrahydrodipicolinate reductase [Chitinophagales bacterium]|jgi:4-hydroxy-tetrahydrodipicolinate reductase|nr:4-hydroxy-tetrahydrodipicolinate reductase [Chitinophagales bacterium]
MNIALVGYGKMGKIIHQLIQTHTAHQVPLIIESGQEDKWNRENLSAIDVIIEFTQPDVVLDNIHRAFEFNTPIVVGTTGWNKQLPEIKKIALDQNQTIFTSSNFSVGVNIMFQTLQYMSGLLANFPEYKPRIHEVHHTQKKDAPSGTAISLADILIDSLPQYQGWKSTCDMPRDKDIPISAMRIDPTPGTHITTFESDIDTLELTHIAHSREGFALGAIRSAEFIQDKKGFFDMNDYFKSLK